MQKFKVIFVSTLRKTDKVFSCVFTTMHQWKILLGAQIPELEKT